MAQRLGGVRDNLLQHREHAWKGVTAWSTAAGAERGWRAGAPTSVGPLGPLHDARYRAQQHYSILRRQNSSSTVENRKYLVKRGLREPQKSFCTMNLLGRRSEAPRSRGGVCRKGDCEDFQRVVLGRSGDWGTILRSRTANRIRILAADSATWCRSQRFAPHFAFLPARSPSEPWKPSRSRSENSLGSAAGCKPAENSIHVVALTQSTSLLGTVTDLRDREKCIGHV